MKRILIIAIFMLASLAWGQIMKFDSVICLKFQKPKFDTVWRQLIEDGVHSEICYLDTFNVFHISPYSPITPSGFIIFWDQYSKECYADSSCKKVHLGTNAFSDFMLWLKKKVSMDIKKDSALYIKVNGNIWGVDCTQPAQKFICDGKNHKVGVK